MSLLVVTGPPGAGKSTVARLVVGMFEPSVLVAGDDFFGFLAQGAIAPWLPESDAQNTIVTRAAAAAAGVFADAGYTTVFDGVLGPWFLKDFVEGTGLDSLAYIVLLPSEEVCVQRVETRADHGFTDRDATRHMHRQFATHTSNLDPRHILVDPPDDPVVTARLLIDDQATGRFTWP